MLQLPFLKSKNIWNRKDLKKNAYLINDEHGINDFGNLAYFVRTKWLKEKIK